MKGEGDYHLTMRRALRAALAVAVVVLLAALAGTARAEPLPGGTLDPTTIPKFKDQLVIPPAMPRSVSTRRTATRSTTTRSR